ncbi:MAG: hypothetical protein AAF628_02600 [Planctomycetota bacterium]
MDVGNIKPGNVERRGEPTVELPRPAPSAVPRGHDGEQDTASISQAGRGLLSAEVLAQGLRAPDPSRASLVEAARQRLESGALDDPAVYRATAEAIVRGDGHAA